MCLAIPGRIKRIDRSDPFLKRAHVAFGTLMKEVCLDMTPLARVGDYVLVHAGVAINVVNEEEAMRTFLYLEEYGGLEDLLPERDQT
ncbi:MAG: HypC/HybG/HupF family hydrogenase formation chaperone [Saprospiraceae bacterium]|jgi:hydrogenase expression/formation protein HypC